MKIFNKISLVTLAVVFTLGLGGLIASYAATTPSLGMATTFGILSSTYTNTTAGTTVSGDIGFTTGPAVAPAGVHINYGSGDPYSTAGINQNSTLSALASQPCTFTFAPGAIDLSTDTTHGSIGVYTPGVYCTSGAGAASIGTGGITLSGSGTYIFRVNGALTTVANSVVTVTGGASACDVFWTPTAATTLGANSTFVGTNIDASGITIGSTVTWTGRALAFGGTVTTDTDTITVPTCTLPSTSATLHVVKQVVNNNGGIATASLFNLHVKLSGADVAGSPAVGVVSPGRSYTLSAGTYIVSEDANASYAQSFGGDCNSSGSVTLLAGDDKICTITNDDIASVPTSATLHVVKQVVNNNGGIATASLFNLHVKLSGADVAGSPAVGVVSPGRSYTLSAGTYIVSEDANASYAQSFGGDCNSSGSVTLLAGDDKICTITNDDIASVPTSATLHVVKQVVNNNGGIATASLFNLHVKLSGADVAGSPAVGVVSPGRSYTLSAGTYIVSEDANASYAQSFGGDCNSSGSVTLLAGDDKICTITNDDIASVIASPTPAPKLPNTGIPSERNGALLDIVILIGILLLISTSLVVVLKKHAV